MASSRRFLAASISRPYPSRHIATVSRRSFSSSHQNPADTKVYEEKDTINVVKDEYSKTGGDHVVAEQKIASYHPGDTKPESQMATAGKGNIVNPLEVSPANPEASKWREEIDVEKGVEKTTISQKGSPKKHAPVERYEKRTEREIWEKASKGRNS
ncbi:hypothetical protein NA57DRAFT_73422 [Rhizodiscina lignyota]|uniref:Uncharacterized protein n=1 Tax=Rhizodiscina lignyota TaxID=1504668 RepID=A0A9P4MC13_9PEZI|nr:hypothetical protein NA57DRAFT_73422 [Rhizodiscina lignyota]